jgi:DNA-binding NarL/FixJ family response regulator
MGPLAAADPARAGAARPRAGTRVHPAELTAREAQVLSLLAEGLPDAAIADRPVISREPSNTMSRRS